MKERSEGQAHKRRVRKETEKVLADREREGRRLRYRQSRRERKERGKEVAASDSEAEVVNEVAGQIEMLKRFITKQNDKKNLQTD